MKKVLSFIILMVCAVTGAWAGSAVTINTNDSNDPNVWTGTSALTWGCPSSVTVIGSINQDGIDYIQTECSKNGDYSSGKVPLYLRQASLNNVSSFGDGFGEIVLPNETSISSFTYGSSLKYVLSNGATDTYLNATEDQTTLPSDLVIVTDGTVTYHLTGTGAEDLANILINPPHNVPEDKVIYTASPKASFTIDETNKVINVHAPVAGQFKDLFYKNFATQYQYDQNYFGYTFRFDNESQINEADLLTLAGGDGVSNSGNHYYVDLFDLTATKELCNWDDPDHQDEVGVITNVIKTMRGLNSPKAFEYNVQFKGLILPKDHTIWGSGTTLIQGINKGADGDLATCSEFIVYYKTKDENQAEVENKLLVAHIYNVVSNGSVTNYQNAYNKMMSLLNEHSEISQTDIYQISTNFQLQSSNGSYTKIDISDLPSGKSIVETYNNEMVGAATKALMVSHPAEGGEFATSATATGMMNTTTEKLTIVGPMNQSDYEAISNFATGKGPRILDLRGVTTPITEALLNKISNSEIEYLVLPETADKDVIFANYKTASNMSGLKAVINAAPAQNSQPTIVANIYEPGSLYEARIHALDLAIGSDGIYHLYSGCGVQSVTLKGTLNAADIAAQVGSKSTTEGGDAVPVYMGADGHWSDVASDNPANFGLGSEQGTLTYFDLEEAVFVPQSDMNFWKAGYEKLTTVKLPTSTQMDRIPANCMNNISTLTELHIPYNYKYIEDGAFWLTKINHITTADAKGALVDNGPLSYTLSANIKELGIRPEPIEKAIPVCVFPFNVGVTDIYALAMETPKCYKNVFPDNTCNGWGGYDSSVPYSRDRYFNGSDHNEAWGVLRFPSKESYITATGSEDGYETMRQRYTDVNKKFSKKEQTGAVDANGDPILWPTHYEGYRVFNQASLGLTWNDWNETHVPTIDGHVNGGGENIKPGTNGTYVYNGGDVTLQENGEGDYSFDDYAGWHQIVLSQATYVEPDEIIENKKIVREYEEAGWYTFCIPFNMTYNQVVEMLGVPKSTDKVINKLNGVEVTGDIMPDIRQLSSVTRKKGEGSGKNIVFLRMTPNLYGAVTPGLTAYLSITYNEHSESHHLYNAEPYNGSSISGEELSLIGGRPYIIKAYKRKQVDKNGVDLFKIKGQNLGKYVLEHYADRFGVESSIVQNTKYEDFLCYEQLYNNKNEGLLSLRFAKPYENHRVQAVRDDKENSAYLTYETDENGNTVTKKYYYTMIGQFWQQDLPQYCLYMSKGNWYRYTTLPANPKDRYTWDPYKCVIMATEEVSGTKGAGYRDETKSVYPEVVEGTADLLEKTFSLAFLDGRDDDDFDGNGTSSRYIFGLDDDIIEFDEDGNEVTAIERLDGEDIVPAGSKVYNVAGQYVGESLNGLTKGLYIVNGKKIVVK